VADALDAAGGFTEEADINAVNQAEALSDGAQVHVPAMDEVVAEPPAGVSGGTRSSGLIIDVAGQVDINSATLDQLLSLPNIGEVKAQAIIDGRPYASIEELEQIDGIGPKTLDKLRDLVVVQ
jgi:competence protein ComEA